MINCRFLFLAVLALSFKCWGGAFGTSDKVFMQGGVCADDPFTIMQTSAPISDGKPKYEFFSFYEECAVIEREEPTSFGPISFIYHPGGKTILSGATYKKIEVREAFIDENDSQVYLYECIKGCTQSPKKIRYIPIFGGDCG